MQHDLRPRTPLPHQGRIVPLHDLQEALGEEPVAADGQMLPVIILRGRTGEIAFVVSKFLGPQKLVNIPLDDGIDHHCAVAGTAVFTGGKLGLTLDVDTLVASTMGRRPCRPSRPRRPPAPPPPTGAQRPWGHEEAAPSTAASAPRTVPPRPSSDEASSLYHELSRPERPAGLAAGASSARPRRPRPSTTPSAACMPPRATSRCSRPSSKPSSHTIWRPPSTTCARAASR